MQTLRRCLFPLFVLVPLIGSILPPTTHAAAEAPIHFHLLCPEREDGHSVACDSMMRLAHVTAWGKDALSRPGSTFTIWSVGSERAGSHLFFAACVPPRWGASVVKAKAAFMALAQEGASGSQSGRVVPERCQPPGPKHPGSHQLAVAVSASTPHSDVWQQVAVGTGGSPLHLAVVCDRSDSTGGAACTPSALLAAFDRWVAQGLMLPVASLSVAASWTHCLF
jgi:hypothetical protein